MTEAFPRNKVNFSLIDGKDARTFNDVLAGNLKFIKTDRKPIAAELHESSEKQLKVRLIVTTSYVDNKIVRLWQSRDTIRASDLANYRPNSAGKFYRRVL